MEKAGKSAILLFFSEDCRICHLVETSRSQEVGVAMLALLVECGIMEEGAFLFIGEPEAHLHPAQEVEIAEALLGFFVPA